MPGFWRNRDRRFLILAVTLILAVILAANWGLAIAYWHNSHTSAAISLKTGTWGPKPSVYKLCPCFGVNNVRRWAVFFQGSNLKRVTGVELVRMTRVVEAKKAWPLSDWLLYCVFDLRGIEAGGYDVVLMVNGRRKTRVSSAFKIYESGSLFSDLEPELVSEQPTDSISSPPVGLTEAALQQGAQKPEDPGDFEVNVSGRNKEGSLVLEVKGPLRSKFRSASLVCKNGIVQGSVSQITRSGCVTSTLSSLT